VVLIDAVPCYSRVSSLLQNCYSPV
jgi:hypothetical protein